MSSGPSRILPLSDTALHGQQDETQSCLWGDKRTGELQENMIIVDADEGREDQENEPGCGAGPRDPGNAFHETRCQAAGTGPGRSAKGKLLPHFGHQPDWSPRRGNRAPRRPGIILQEPTPSP